jgi:SAM-dependent methyltransferase
MPQFSHLLPRVLESPQIRAGYFALPAILGVMLCISGGLAAAEEAIEKPEKKPGINDKYLSPDLDVADWTKKFEGESRQIFVARDEIVAALELEPKDRVADVGAGTGLFTELMARAVGANGLVWAVEISPKFAEHLRVRFKEEGKSQVEVVENSDRSTMLAESSIDLAFICDVYHHFEYPKDMLRNLKYVLRGKGRLVVVDFERIPGESEPWILDHVRADKKTFRGEIEEAGFIFDKEIEIEGLKDNYILQFRRP